jgi:hypothetical protein
VFLWLKLVVDELIKGLCEGDSIAELQEYFSSNVIHKRAAHTSELRRSRDFRDDELEFSTIRDASFQIHLY